jgi:hypothetical protein
MADHKTVRIPLSLEIVAVFYWEHRGIVLNRM